MSNRVPTARIEVTRRSYEEAYRDYWDRIGPISDSRIAHLLSFMAGQLGDAERRNDRWRHCVRDTLVACLRDAEDDAALGAMLDAALASKGYVTTEDGYRIAPSEPSSGYDLRHMQDAARAKIGGGEC